MLVAARGFAGVEGLAEDGEGLTEDDDVVVRTKGSHRLLLPKDWPVEHRDGLIVLIPTEEYLSMKFGQVKEELAATRRQLEALARRVEQLEREQNALQRRLRAPEARSEEKGG